MAKKTVQDTSPQYIGGGTKVTLTKDFEQFGYTHRAGSVLTVDSAGYKLLLKGGYLHETAATDPIQEITKPNKNE